MFKTALTFFMSASLDARDVLKVCMNAKEAHCIGTTKKKRKKKKTYFLNLTSRNPKETQIQSQKTYI